MLKNDLRVALDGFQSIAFKIVAALPYVFIAIIVYLLFHIGAKNVRKLITRLSDRKHKQRNAGLLLGSLAEGGLMLLGGLIALMIVVPSFEPKQLVELLGIGSVAIGFAFREVLQNFLSGILLLITEPFQINDQIVVGKYEGTVEEIQGRATLLRTYDGRRVVIPNSTLFTESVIVNTAYAHRRLEFDVRIGHADDIETARSVLLNAVQGLPQVLRTPAPEVLVVDLASSSINLRLRWWIDPPRQQDAVESQDRVLTAVRNGLKENGIDLPFPTQQILFHDQTEETDGNRMEQREGWPAGRGKVPRMRSLASVMWRRGDRSSVNEESNGQP